LPLVEQSVDLLVSNLMLHLCERLDLVFDQFRRVLKPGGLLLFSYPGPDTLSELRQSWAAVDDQPHVQLFLDMHDIGDALLAAGFADPVLDVERLTLTYGDVDQLLRELKNLGGSNAALDRRRSLTGKYRMQAMKSRYREMHLDNRIPATFEVVYGMAWGPPTEQPRRSADGQVSSFPVEQLRGSRAPKR
jgi:malonyl-CoA O-methyltransferase